ncbi:MAG: peptidoglycan DD-metalloendopeptidase family protein [Muribaculaceae bacterium]
MKKVLLSLAVAMLAALLLAPEAMGDNRVRRVKRQQQTNQRELRETKRKLSANTTATKRQLNALNRITAEIEEKNREIGSLTAISDSLSREITIIRDSITYYETKHKRLSENYAKAVRAVHSHSSSLDMLLFIFSSDSFKQAVRRYRYIRQFARWREKQSEEIRAARGKLVEKRTQLETALRSKSTAIERLNLASSDLLSRQSRQQTIVTNLQGEAATLKRVMAEQQRQAAELDRRLGELIAEEERAAAARAAAEAEQRRKKADSIAAIQATKPETADTKPAKSASEPAKPATKPTKPATKPAPAKPITKTTGYTMTAEERTLSGSFESNKGNLLFPVTGKYRIVKPFGRQKHPELKYVETDNGGIDIEVPGGTAARAVFEGKVTGIFKPDGYNTVVLIRHGNYITVYANLASITVKPGQMVKTGETIGTIFTDPDDDNNAILHFEIRKEREKLNPTLWVK